MAQREMLHLSAAKRCCFPHRSIRIFKLRVNMVFVRLKLPTTIESEKRSNSEWIGSVLWNAPSTRPDIPLSSVRIHHGDPWYPWVGYWRLAVSVRQRWRQRKAREEKFGSVEAKWSKPLLESYLVLSISCFVLFCFVFVFLYCVCVIFPCVRFYFLNFLLP